MDRTLGLNSHATLPLMVASNCTVIFLSVASVLAASVAVALATSDARALPLLVDMLFNPVTLHTSRYNGTIANANPNINTVTNVSVSTVRLLLGWRFPCRSGWVCDGS